MLTDELVARRPKGRVGLADWYAEVFRAQAAEDLGMVDLATLVGVTVTNLYYWRRRLRKLGVAEAVSKPNGLVEVKASGSASRIAAGDNLCSLRLIVGPRSIMVPPNFDPSSLRQLIAVLESC